MRAFTFASTIFAATVAATQFGATAQAQTTAPATAETTSETTSQTAPETMAEYDASTVLAVVNDKEITLGHLIVLLERLPEQYQTMPDDRLFKGMLDQLVDQAILEDVASAPGTPTDTRTALMLENERRSILSNRLVETLAAVPLDEAAVLAAYETQFGAAAPKMENNASHILVATAEEATAIVAELGAGADFATLAGEKSTGPSGPNGGSLGWFGPGQMVQPFEEAVNALEVGAISEPVQTQFGWHVIKLNERRETPPPALEDVRAELEQALRDEAIGAKLEELRQGATVERLDPALPFSAIREGGLLDQ